MQWHNKLKQLAKGNVVTSLWIPGHIEIIDNEKADELASRGSETRFISLELNLIRVLSNRNFNLFKLVIFK